MDIIDSIFDGLFGYEKLMLICGFTLFVFALLAITALIVFKRNIIAAMGLIVLAIVLMGFPGIQSVKFSKDLVELDRLRATPDAPTDPAQKQQAQQTLSELQQRAGDNPQLLAKVSDGYRAIGEVDKAYVLANTVLSGKPSAAVQQTLIPVLTAKLNQLQSAVRVPAPAEVAVAPASPVASDAPIHVDVGTPITGSAPAPTSPAVPVTAGPSGARRTEIVKLADQLQGVAAPLPAASRIALANAYVKLGEPQKAKVNIQQAREINPKVKLNPVLQHAMQTASPPAH
ncbi:MAG: tetratricopeptide repeat protein [Rhodanobacter sp.]